MVSTSYLIQFATVALTAVVCTSTTGVDAHGVLSKPALVFTGTAYGGDFSSDVPPDTMPAIAPDKYTFNVAWGDVFERSFKAQTKYKSLRQYIMANQVMANGRKKNPSTPECGFTDPDKQTPQPLPDKLEWYGGQQNHPGPCEAWCDNEIVLPFTANCQKTFPDGKFTYDKSKCVGKNRLSFYWMATLYQFQVYIDCVRIGPGAAVPFDASAGGGGGASAGNATTPAAPAPAPAPSKAPVAGESTPAPKPTSAPAPVPVPKPATSCKTKRVRRD